MITQGESATVNNTESVIARIKKLLRLDDKQVDVLMPHGEHTQQGHFVGGYIASEGKSWKQQILDEEAKEGWRRV